ncbi:hypothetical protein SNE40_004945 [Patella caerulea]
MLCNKKNIESVKDLTVHLTEHIRNGSSVDCPVKGCTYSYGVASSFTSHISRSHRLNNLHVLKDEYFSQHDSPTSNAYMDDNNDTQADYPCTAVVSQGNFEHSFLASFALSLLKLQEMCYLPVSTMDTILSEITSITELSLDSLRHNLINILFQNDIDVNILDQVKRIFEENVLQRSVQSMKTDYLRNRHWKEQLRFIKPIRISLEKNSFHQNQYFEYIPILESLKSLLSNVQVLHDVLNPLPSSRRGILVDFNHGNHFKQNELFSTCSHALQVILYFDEFEVVNPLGSKRGIHKIAAIYFNLANIHPWHRSELKTIQLCLLCPNKVLKNVGFGKVLEPLIYDLKILENEGIIIPNLTEKLYGTVAFVSGDNLGSHQIGGFTESFGSNVHKICRFCMASPEQIQTNHDPNQFELRDENNYKAHVEQVACQPISANFMHGIKCDSPLNNLKYFHVTRGLPPDCMHDILEGCCRYEIPLILQKLEKGKHFSKNDVMRTLQTWKYGENDILTKPPVPKSLTSIPASASQMWTLLRLLPLMLGKYIPRGHRTFEILLILKDISEIVFAPKINVNQLAYLQSLISDHADLFIEEFPEQRVIPKQHYLSHYPLHILNFGPLRSTWCMRFEAKHNYFKILSHRIGNYTNICHTLSTRHQRMQAYLTATNHTFFKSEEEILSSSVVLVKTLRHEIQEALIEHDINDLEITQISKMIKSGVVYKAGMYMITNYSADNDVEFSQILGVYRRQKLESASNADLFFVLERQKSVYDEHLRAYEVMNTGNINVCIICDLLDSYPLDEYVQVESKYVCLKHSVINVSVQD